VGLKLRQAVQQELDRAEMEREHPWQPEPERFRAGRGCLIALGVSAFVYLTIYLAWLALR
jgi:hypothetical protein